MRTLSTLAIISLLALTVTTGSGVARAANDASLFAQSEPPEVKANAEQPEPEKRERRKIIRVRDGKPFVWSFDGDGWSFGEGGTRGYLGVGVIRMTSELRQHFGAPAERGVLVSKVVDDSPAAAAGIAVGDILLSVDGEPIAEEWDLIREIGKHGDGQTVSIEVLRDDATFSVTPALEERDRQVVDLMPLFHEGELGKGVEEFHIQVPDFPDAEAMEKVIAIREKDIERAMEGLDKRLNSPEFRERIAEATRRSAELERRTAELERRLAQLQRQLERLQAQQNP
ncbi:MAG: PDZ domain-containing protein [Thermoanaerobaculia bacterium]